ncbi:MAG TPA: VOC family protein [Acidimicrobiales bacterium]|nr:VOC family protein [Acidimicrobiales bacterium]
MIRGIDLDHVAVATADMTTAWPRYAHELGGRWVSGGKATGFSTAQVRYANGMKVEILEPWAVDENDFLRRFLDRNGPGPHHLTFKVDDIVAALGACEQAGYRPVAVDLTSEGWKEAFLHPKDALGIVVQLAESAGDWANAAPSGFPAPRRGTATLLRVVHAVADLDDALALFAGLLGGTEHDATDEADGRWVEVAWPGPGRVRLVQPAPGSEAAAWMGDRAGRVHHLAFGCPWLVDGVVVAPEDNLGTRLVCFPAEAAGT